VVVETRGTRQERFHRFHVDAADGDDHRAVGAELVADRLDHVVAGHLGHGDVADHDLRLEASHDAHHVLPSIDALDLVALVLEDRRQRVDRVRVVVANDDPQRAGMSANRVVPGTRRSPPAELPSAQVKLCN